MGVPVIASTSSIERPSSTIKCIVDMPPYTPMRLPMKLGVSLPTTTPLPSTS
jgi:hypothetical protein